jgi:hypothetical protein
VSRDGLVVVIWRFQASQLAEVNVALDGFPPPFYELCLLPELDPDTVEFVVEIDLDEFDDFEAAARQVTADIITRARDLRLPGIPISVDATDDEFSATWNITPEGEIIFSFR